MYGLRSSSSPQNLKFAQISKLYLNPPSWYASQPSSRLQYHLSETVISLSPSEHTLLTSNDRTIQYDHCVLATGSFACLPEYLTKEQVEKTKGVFVYRNVGDLEKIMKHAETLKNETVKRAIVVGGGLLGLEAAKAVHDLETCAFSISSRPLLKKELPAFLKSVSSIGDLISSLAS